MYHVLRKLEGAHSNIWLRAIFTFTYFQKPPRARMPLYFHQKPGELRINLCWLRIFYEQSLKVAGMSPNDGVWDYASEDFRLETCRGFSLSYGRIQ